ncbi:hypothetical protein CHARACLAT_032145 [Characodon lateralis]|uniref:Uncharacterized protein n=1 Tax=Characodon lateralis TaxID=208331 RepID=A0ABU7EEN0_9TELE|nr:hypothetical protein [Characodon lateralis]
MYSGSSCSNGSLLMTVDEGLNVDGPSTFSSAQTLPGQTGATPSFLHVLSRNLPNGSVRRVLATLGRSLAM